MTVLQTWIVLGVPGIILMSGLFIGRSKWRAWIGYEVIVALVLAFVLIPGDTISAAAIGLIGFVLVATGRGTNMDDAAPEHHENRKRYTTDPSQA